jgi:ssDNA-binding Zn-finger/Zn-ribbon topoisomerase 1
MVRTDEMNKNLFPACHVCPNCDKELKYFEVYDYDCPYCYEVLPMRKSIMKNQRAF